MFAMSDLRNSTKAELYRALAAQCQALIAGETDPDYVAEVDGEVVNDTSPFTLTSARLSVVLLDASGKIVGGGTGIVYSPLPSGSRMVFLAQSGFTGIPSSTAVVPIITVEPTYATS